MLPNPVHFGLNLPPIGSYVGEISAKLVDSLGSVPVSNIPGPPASFYGDSFQYLRNKKTVENESRENEQAQPAPSISAKTNGDRQSPVEAVSPDHDQDAIHIPESATLTNSPDAIRNDVEAARQYDQSLNGNQAVQDVSPV